MNLELDREKHKSYMCSILKDIYSDKELSDVLAFKGGTSLYFFHNLERFSVDLDFNLLDKSKEEIVYKKVTDILCKYGKIKDSAIKHYGSVAVLNYEEGHHKLKVEISNREYKNHYEKQKFFGMEVRVMVLEDMFAHKLCALLDRKAVAGRDVFDCWHFLNKCVAINKDIVESRMGKSLSDHLSDCIETLKNTDIRTIMDGLGEVTEGSVKVFARNKLKEDTIDLLQKFRELPIIKNYERTSSNITIGELYRQSLMTSQGDMAYKLLCILDLLKAKENANEKLLLLNSSLKSLDIKNDLVKTTTNDTIKICTERDIRSLEIVMSISKEYEAYSLLEKEKKIQEQTIKEVSTMQIAKETQLVLINNCNTIIAEKESQQQNLRYYQEFCKAEQAKKLISVFEETNKSLLEDTQKFANLGKSALLEAFANNQHQILSGNGEKEEYSKSKGKRR